MSNRITFLFICLSFLVLREAFAQPLTKIVPDKKRTTLWKPASGQYYFSHLMTFEFDNKYDNRQGTVAIYLDPVTGALCYERSKTFGTTAEFYDYILAFPDGQFISCGVDEAGKKFKVKETIVEFKPDEETRKQQQQDFESFCQLTGNNKEFFGWKTQEYKLAYPKSEVSEELWLAEVPFSVYPLYGFSLIEGTASLPVSFDFIDLIGPKHLLTEYKAKELTIKLVSIEFQPLTLNTGLYKELKLAD